MVFIYLIGFIVLTVTVYSITELVLHHKKEIAKMERSDFICKKCRSNTPVVIDTLSKK